MALPIALVQMRCGDVSMFTGSMGRKAGHIAVRIADKVAREVESGEVWDVFTSVYAKQDAPLRLINYWPRPHADDPSQIDAAYRAARFGGAPVEIVPAALGDHAGAIGAALLALDT